MVEDHGVMCKDRKNKQPKKRMAPQARKKEYLFIKNVKMLVHNNAYLAFGDDRA
jgi:hypothetical protein